MFPSFGVCSVGIQGFGHTGQLDSSTAVSSSFRATISSVIWRTWLERATTANDNYCAGKGLFAVAEILQLPKRYRWRPPRTSWFVVKKPLIPIHFSTHYSPYLYCNKKVISSLNQLPWLNPEFGIIQSNWIKYITFQSHHRIHEQISCKAVYRWRLMISQKKKMQL